MTEFKKVFLDTSPFIYYLENNPQYHKRVKVFLTNDKQLKQFTEIKCMLVEELEG